MLTVVLSLLLSSPLPSSSDLPWLSAPDSLSYRNGGSRKAHNSWHRLRFSSDEGMDGSSPLVDCLKGGL